MLPLRDDPARERGPGTRHRPVRGPGHERPAAGRDEERPGVTVPMTGVHPWDLGARSVETRRPRSLRVVAFSFTSSGPNPFGRAVAGRN